MKEVLLSTMREPAGASVCEPVGGKCDCVCVCVFLHTCSSGCMQIFLRDVGP